MELRRVLRSLGFVPSAGIDLRLGAVFARPAARPPNSERQHCFYGSIESTEGSLLAACQSSSYRRKPVSRDGGTVMDFRKLGTLVLCIGVGILLYGGLMFLSNQPVAYTSQTNADPFKELSRIVDYYGEALNRDGLRHKARSTMTTGLTIAVIGAVILLSAKKTGHQRTTRNPLGSGDTVASSPVASQFCTECGNRLEAGLRFCPACGTAIQ